MTLVPSASTGLAGVAGVTAADGSVVVGGTSTNPTVRASQPAIRQASFWHQSGAVATGGKLTWTLNAGSDSGLFNLTNPLQPVALLSGLYSVSAYVNMYSAPQAGKHLWASMTLDLNDSILGGGSASSVDLGGLADGITCPLTATWFLAAGAPSEILVVHDATNPQLELYATVAYMPATTTYSYP